MKTVGLKTFDVADSLLNAYATNERINAYLISHLPDEAWAVKAPGGKGRSAAGMIGHMHNVRLMWLKVVAAGTELPPKLEADGFTKEQAIAALQKSHEALQAVLRKALGGDGKVKGFKPDVCSFVAYLLAHDAHHRGQVSMLARQLGHALPQSAMFGMWEWGTR